MIRSILLGIVAVAFAVYVYKFPPSNNDLSKSICMNYSNTDMSQLEVPLVHEMVNGYKDNQLFHINNQIRIDDAHSIWFDLETLKAFMYHIEMNAKESEFKLTDKDLGLRIYYSRYPESKSWEDHKDLQGQVDQNCEKLHTLLMIPTINKKGLNMDFNPLDIRTYTENLKHFEDYSNPNSNYRTPALGLMNTRNSSSSSGAQNHGSLFPPKTTNGHGF